MAYDHILVPTDGNPRTPRVVEHALALADLSDATVHVLSVVDGGRLPEGATAEVLDALEDDAHHAVKAVADLVTEHGRPVRTEVRHGRPHDEILEYVDEADVDLVVMGTHGRSGVSRVILGSVAERVVRSSEVPVVTVNLARQGNAVADAGAATDVAREALDAAGHAVESFPESPYRESMTWVVRAETRDGGTYNVHINAATGEARLARIDRHD